LFFPLRQSERFKSQISSADLWRGALRIEKAFFANAKKMFFYFFALQSKLCALQNKKTFHFRERLFLFVGVARFELTTSCSQSRRDTGLRYTPRILKNF
jgi:hypothetical protein